jgi:thioredoxin 2
LTSTNRGILVACTNCGKKNRLAFDKLGVAVRCGQCKQPLAMVNTPVELHATADFDRIVAQSSLPVLVDYWAPWCGPCRMVAPELEKVAARQSGKLLVVKVNTDELADLGQRHNDPLDPDDRAVSRTVREAARMAGARQASDIEAWAQQTAQAAHQAAH